MPLLSKSAAAGLYLFALTPFAALANPVEPGQEGQLAELVPPQPGARACYSRVYDAAHLAKHPKQKVTEMTFRLAYYRHDPDTYAPLGQRNYYFELDAKVRGQPKKLTAGGECSLRADGKSIFCGVECDGGGVIISRKPEPGKLLVDLESQGYLRMTVDCDEEEADEAETYELKPGADDKQFLLTQTEASACPAYDDW